jgi:hypothetical protein
MTELDKRVQRHLGYAAVTVMAFGLGMCAGVYIVATWGWLP